jgi:hypothetical protein
MQRDDPETVAKQMHSHLQIARTKVIDRLAVFRRHFAGLDLPYIG